MPGNVPTEPEFRTVDEVVTALEPGGIECVVPRRRADRGLDCVAEVDRVEVEDEVHVPDPGAFDRDEVGDSLARWRTPPRPQTIVTAGKLVHPVLRRVAGPVRARAVDRKG